MRHTISSYQEDNSEVARSDGDDLGLPENPIYSNFSRHLWTAHTRHGSVQSPHRSRENTDGPQRPENVPMPAKAK